MSETTGQKPINLCNFEVEFLEDRWEGVKGAAYNATYEFCFENGLCDRAGKITAFGQKILDNHT